MSTGELILYVAADGGSHVQLRADGGTVWLTQAEIAELFQTTTQNISQHIKAIYAEGELQPAATCKEDLQVRSESGRRVRRSLNSYSLEMILAIGYRVRSPRGVQFRQWATTHLREYLLKGFVMDDARLKQAPAADYFDELLARIRDIRSSEKVFWRKVLDIYATSVDYDARAEASQRFFAIVQNKMHWAAHGHTAAETVNARADATAPSMGLTSWDGAAKGAPPRQADARIAKNYLQGDELDALNRIVTAYLEFAELQAIDRKPMTMAGWIAKLDEFIRLAGREVLTHAGRVSREQADAHADAQYARFNAARLQQPSAVEVAFDAAVAQTITLARKRKGKA